MKRLLFGALLLSIAFLSCKKEDYAANFEGTYNGSYTEGAITFNDVTATLSKKSTTEVAIVLDLGIISATVNATADSETQLTIASQPFGTGTVTGTGSLKDSKELALALNYSDGTSGSFKGTKQ